VLESVTADRMCHCLNDRPSSGPREEKLDWDWEKSNFFRCLQPALKSCIALKKT